MDSAMREEQVKVYRQCIDTLFSRWTALRLALEHWNRPTEECRALLETLQQAIVQAGQDNELSREFLETLFEETFDILQVDVEDGSIEQVSCLLCDRWKDCLQGNMETLMHFLNHRVHTGTHLVSSVWDNSFQVHDHQAPTMYSLPEESVETSDSTIHEDGFQRVQRRHR
ncbi:hypothetical protein GpartN1_g2555.t1 [Galdieria partita]|uniref:Pre-rRNA-processing protein TSR2 homolog n=1 Tax=Galdieria partita TaxID=83374 RepID=A0A9C7UPB7_9RHOD|nr:hypothetical protein GpartN1_g2555.t1 [Galdieria partita]